VALAYEGAPMGLVSTVRREGAGRGAPPAPGRLFSSYRAPRGFGVFGHPCAKVLMGEWLFDTIPSKVDVASSSLVSRSAPHSDVAVARASGPASDPIMGRRNGSPGPCRRTWLRAYGRRLYGRNTFYFGGILNA
jgi:hypothetical protein